MEGISKVSDAVILPKHLSLESPQGQLTLCSTFSPGRHLQFPTAIACTAVHLKSLTARKARTRPLSIRLRLERDIAEKSVRFGVVFESQSREDRADKFFDRRPRSLL